LAGAWLVVLYNGPARGRNLAAGAQSGMNTIRKCRASPIPDLVSTVQGSMAHELGILERAIGNGIQLARRYYNDAAKAPGSRSGSPGDGEDGGGGKGWSRQSGKKPAVPQP